MDIIKSFEENFIEYLKKLKYSKIGLLFRVSKENFKEEINKIKESRSSEKGFEKIMKRNGFEPEIIIDCEQNIVQKIKNELKKVKFIYFAKREDFLKNFNAIIKKYDYISGLEKLERFDYFNQAKSGLNHVIAKEFFNNNIEIIVEHKAIKYARTSQNLNIAKKSKVEINICSFAKNKFELIDQYDKNF